MASTKSQPERGVTTVRASRSTPRRIASRALFGGDGEAARLLHFFGRLSGANILLKSGLHVAGADQHGAYAVAHQFHALAFGERAEGGLGDAVEGHPGEHHLAADRAHVDQHAAAAGAHVRRDELRHGERREEIQLHEVAGLVHGHLPGGLVDADAGIVDEDIDGAETLQRAVNDAAAVLVIGDVGGGDEGIGGRGAAQALFIAGGEGEPGAGGGELAGTGRADALGGSRDEHNFAVNSAWERAAEAAYIRVETS